MRVKVRARAFGAGFPLPERWLRFIFIFAKTNSNLTAKTILLPDVRLILARTSDW